MNVHECDTVRSKIHEMLLIEEIRSIEVLHATIGVKRLSFGSVSLRFIKRVPNIFLVCMYVHITDEPFLQDTIRFHCLLFLVKKMICTIY